MIPHDQVVAFWWGVEAGCALTGGAFFLILAALFWRVDQKRKAR